MSEREHVNDPGSLRPAPRITPESEPFWRASGGRTLFLGVCADCERCHIPPRHVCPFCWSSRVTEHAARGRGTVAAVTVVYQHANPNFSSRTPYAIAVVQLEEGPSMVTALVGDRSCDAAIGDSVTVQFDRTDEKGVFAPVFTIDGEASDPVPNHPADRT